MWPLYLDLPWASATDLMALQENHISKTVRAQTFCSQDKGLRRLKTVSGLRGEHSKNEQSGWHPLPWPCPWALFPYLPHPPFLRWVLLFVFYKPHLFIYVCTHLHTTRCICVHANVFSSEEGLAGVGSLLPPCDSCHWTHLIGSYCSS